MIQNPESQWFGEQPVTPEEKTSKVHGVFEGVARNYDIMNDLMSGGVHRLWKDSFVRRIRPRPGLKYLDVAGGTGDIAFRIRRKAGDGAHITLCDLTYNMLEVGRDRAINKGWLNGFDWVTGNAESLPFPDNSFDVYTISFGLRNVTHIDNALMEARRVLKPGGRFFCLEFSHVRMPLLAKAYDAYSYNVIPKIGEIVAKDRESYQYLVESIRKFPSQRALVKRMEAAGFEWAEYSNLTGGIACIHSGVRL
ncbi:MAG: bifunctional demethylmenaquinone methyltransferase/2-methoxy-6-polyprenyl-1,4-benzoquinol methylase UbiE [Alphaproteobacteria bacterium]|nr:bifunctional demethylmenaquinone methyltransferase/2-methoxy-6-polyprenyl-1,4-benzoquinol methylase UbiE [Alphaproteobacteria bacterium]MCD8571313.1 bifunctional demethylmenaquinone methyltransferase/2-methoxy-6-polyprenyl-1,4-benzoquinol methylase UbiE [Alphaproteobacteria bacterium]